MLNPLQMNSQDEVLVSLTRVKLVLTSQGFPSAVHPTLNWTLACVKATLMKDDGDVPYMIPSEQDTSDGERALL